MLWVPIYQAVHYWTAHMGRGAAYPEVLLPEAERVRPKAESDWCWQYCGLAKKVRSHKTAMDVDALILLYSL